MSVLTRNGIYDVVGRNGNPIYSAIPIHPGDVLRDEVEDRELKKTDFAREIGILPGHLSEIFNGKRNINAKLAIKLEKALNISAEFWLRMQNRYELTILRNQNYHEEIA